MDGVCKVVVNKDNWGVRLKRIRENRGLSAKELADRSGMSPAVISKIENGKSPNPMKSTITKLARGLGMAETTFSNEVFGVQELVIRHDTLQEALQRVILSAPDVIPVYPDYLHAGKGVEPLEYIYRSRGYTAGKNVQAFFVRGDCLLPYIEDGDIAVVDLDGTIDNGDLVACLMDGQLHIAKYKTINGEHFLENRFGTRKIEDCTQSAVVLEITKRVKKNYIWNKEG